MTSPSELTSPGGSHASGYEYMDYYPTRDRSTDTAYINDEGDDVVVQDGDVSTVDDPDAPANYSGPDQLNNEILLLLGAAAVGLLLVYGRDS